MFRANVICASRRRRSLANNGGTDHGKSTRYTSPDPSPVTVTRESARRREGGGELSAILALGLPGRVRACLFDLDGVLTQTAKVHAAAWKEMFDTFLKARSDSRGEPFAAFDQTADYDTYVDGKLRADGTRSFLRSRHIRARRRAAPAASAALPDLPVTYSTTRGNTGPTCSLRPRIFPLRDLRDIARFDRVEFALALITLLTVALIGVQEGIGVAVGLAILDRTRLTARPQLHVLGRIPATTSWAPLSSAENAQQVPGVLVVRFATPLWYANAAHFRTEIAAAQSRAIGP